MYNGNGTPPFRPPPAGMPPFAPNGAPSAFPPFAPPQGFIPPPFPPNFAPVAGASGPGTSPLPPPMGMGTGMGMRPPPAAPGAGGSMYPPRPSHPGLGLPPLPTGMPTPPGHGGQRFQGSGSGPSPIRPPGFVREVKTTSVFVGSISPGITDDMLKDLLNACGPLHELKRVSGAGGKPQAFGFALFENPEVVMRCLRCLNGVELPDLTPEGRAQRKPAKALVVKVDDKTKQFLDEFEQALGRSDDEESADAMCRKSIANLIQRFINPNGTPQAGAQTPAGAGNGPRASNGGRSPIEVIVPAHLQDLKEGDLPENQRVMVLDQIAGFRESSMRFDREKKRQDEEKERYKSMTANQPFQSGPSDYGYGNRALSHQHHQQQQQQQQRGGERPWPGQQTSQASGSGGQGSHSSGARDPQGYSDPVNFVRAKEAESKVDSDRTDEEEEQLRQQRRDRERDAALRERERRVENRERQRIDSLNRELAHRKQQAELEERTRRHQAKTFEEWDDDEKAERGREWFYTDRTRWRARRQQQRQREYQDDVRDRQAEEDERKQLERESEEFLRKQMEELADMEGKQKNAGLLSEDLAPIKLAIAPPAVPAVKKEEKKEDKADKPVPRPAVEFAEDEEESGRRKHRTFVKLEAEETDPLADGLTEAERQAQRNARLLQLRKRVPSDRKSLWSQRIDWKAITEPIIQKKIVPYVHDQMREFIGEVDEDLAEFVVEQVKARKGPDDFVDGLEPVLAEEAVAFTVKLWRLLTFESMAYGQHMDTGSMLV